MQSLCSVVSNCIIGVGVGLMRNLEAENRSRAIGFFPPCMMRREFFLLLPLVASLSPLPAAPNSQDVCVGCTIVMALASEGAVADLEKAALRLCKNETACDLLVTGLVKLAEAGVSPDKACTAVKLCDGTCALFADKWPVPNPPPPPQWPPRNSSVALALTSLDAGGDERPDLGKKPAHSQAGKFAPLRSYTPHSRIARLFGAIGGGPAHGKRDFYSVVRRSLGFLACLAGASPDTCALQVEEIATRNWVSMPSTVSAVADSRNPCGLNLTCNIRRFTDLHYPLVDGDGDGFGAGGNGTLRGWHWRGRDCLPDDATSYPGRKAITLPSDVDADHDCNGISGSNASGPLEDHLCGATPRRGLIVLGDSASAHFHIPPQWLTAAGWSTKELASWTTLLAAEDELDRPDCSWGTGFRTAEECPYGHGFPMKSIYQRLRARNLCNHRDYQNQGVNGMRITDIFNIVNSTVRHAELDHPALVMFALLGNDVCNGHPGSSHWTPVDSFREHALSALAKLDRMLPPGSHVAALGLVDGRVLYENMHALQHPLGSTYKELYGFLSCLGLNPCWGWLNSNSTWRDATTAHAEQLNSVYQDIAASQNFSNFTFIFHQPDWKTYIADYVAGGGEAADLIEPIDGFHPSQAGNQYLASALWDFLLENHPEALGPINPHNEEIARRFGDQGGH